MAGYKGHLVGGAIFGGSYLAILMYVMAVPLLVHSAGILPAGWQRAAALVALALLFALWPDVDTNSKGQDIFFAGIFVLDLFLIFNRQMEAAAYLGLLAMLPIVGHHRGWTHTYWAMLLVPSPILIVPYLYNPNRLETALLYYGAAVVGYFSHLFLDGLVVPWFRIRSHAYKG